MTSDNLPGREPQRRRPGLDSARLWGWSIGLIVLLLVGGAAVHVLVSRQGVSSGGKPVDARSAAVGDEMFNRAAARCRLEPGTGPPAGTQQSGLLLGLSASVRLYSGRARCEEVRLAQATGVRAVREDLSWALAEPQPNRYNWSVYDNVVRTATESGLLLLPVLDDSPAWAAPTGASLPSSPGAYAAFVGAAVARYGPGGAFWRANPHLPARPLVWYELWNEPYFAEGNRDPGVYARLAQAATIAGRAANPSARFLIEGDTSYQTSGGGQSDWIAGMYAAVPDLGKYFDALAVHPYGGDPAIYTPQGDTAEQPGRIEQAHGELAAHGDGSKPIWVTEIGWSTCSGADVCVSEAQQAAYLHELLELARTTWRSYVRAVFVYQLRDMAPNPLDDVGAWFGLLRPNLSRKPAWFVLHDVAQGTQ
jgi:hypothetical protein